MSEDRDCYLNIKVVPYTPFKIEEKHFHSSLHKNNNNFFNIIV